MPREKIILVTQNPEEWEVQSYTALIGEACSECGQVRQSPDLEALGRAAANGLWERSPAEFNEVLYMELKRLRACFKLDN